jgi:Rad3-related DNA helicase
MRDIDLAKFSYMPNLNTFVTKLCDLSKRKSPRKRKVDEEIIFEASHYLRVHYDRDYMIQLKCVNAKYVFECLQEYFPAHSIILTSGTLSPLETLSSDLGINFS